MRSGWRTKVAACVAITLAAGCYSGFADDPAPAAGAAPSASCVGAACGDAAADSGAPATSPTSVPGGGGALLDAEAAALCPGTDLAQAPRLADAKGVFVAGGLAQRATVSGDGLHWESDHHTVPADAAAPAVSLLSIAAGPGLLVAASDDGIMTSTDGKTWTPRAVTEVQQYVRYDNGFYSVVYGKGAYIVAASAAYRKQAFYRSVDGINWPDMPFVVNDGDVCCHPIVSMVFANDRFVGVGAARRTIVSDDGITWHDQRMPVDGQGNYFDSVNYRSVTYGNGVYVAVGSPSIVAHSTNGIDWIDADTVFPAGDFSSVVFDGSKFITCSRLACYSSTDGATWTAAPGTMSDPRPTVAIMRQGDLFVGLDVPAQILTSHDGLSWTPVYCGAPPQLRSLSFLPAP